MDRLWQVAPPGTWALLGAASVCLLAAFLLLSHSLVRRKAHGDGWSGWLAPGRLEATVRGGLALLLAGGFLWALALDAPALVLAGLAAAAAVPALAQAYALVRAR